MGSRSFRTASSPGDCGLAISCADRGFAVPGFAVNLPDASELVPNLTDNRLGDNRQQTQTLVSVELGSVVCAAVVCRPAVRETASSFAPGWSDRGVAVSGRRDRPR